MVHECIILLECWVWKIEQNKISPQEFPATSPDLLCDDICSFYSAHMWNPENHIFSTINSEHKIMGKRNEARRPCPTGAGGLEYYLPSSTSRVALVERRRSAAPSSRSPHPSTFGVVSSLLQIARGVHQHPSLLKWYSANSLYW